VEGQCCVGIFAVNRVIVIWTYLFAEAKFISIRTEVADFDSTRYESVTQHTPAEFDFKNVVYQPERNCSMSTARRQLETLHTERTSELVCVEQVDSIRDAGYDDSKK